MADVKAMVRDPEFQALPWKERHQLLAMKDPEYAALPSEDQAAVMNDLKSRDWWQPAAAVEEKPKSSVARRVLGDTGISALKGTIGLTESAVGLADMVSGGRAGKALEEAGYRPKQAREILDTLYSPEQQEANAAVQSAQGFVPTLKAAVQNPSTIAHAAIESAPSMIGAGGMARGIMKVAPRVAPVIAGALGEGAMSAGSTAEQVRQETGTLTPKQAAISAASGAATSALGVIGGKVAQKLGIADIDTFLASGAPQQQKKNVVKAVIEGMISEGALEELPQSAQEQMAQNLALGKPAGEGVGNAAAQGMITGGLMGGGGNVIANAGPLSRAVSRVDATAVTPQSAFNDAVAAKDDLAAVVGDEAANKMFAKADEQVSQTGEQDGARYYQQVQQALNAELERAKAQPAIPATEAITEQPIVPEQPQTGGLISSREIPEAIQQVTAPQSDTQVFSREIPAEVPRTFAPGSQTATDNDATQALVWAADPATGKYSYYHPDQIAKGIAIPKGGAESDLSSVPEEGSQGAQKMPSVRQEDVIIPQNVTTPQGATNAENVQAEGNADEARRYVQAPAEGDAQGRNAQENADDGGNEAALQARGRNEDAQRDERGVAARPKTIYHVSPKENRDNIAAKGLTVDRDQTGMGAVYFTDTAPEPSDSFDVWSTTVDQVPGLEDDTDDPAEGERWFRNFGDIPPSALNLVGGENKPKQEQPLAAKAPTTAALQPEVLKSEKLVEPAATAPDSTRAILSTLASPKRKSDASIAKLTAAHGRDAVNQLVTSGLITFPGKGMAELTKKGRDHLSTLPRPLSPLEEKQLANLAKNGKRTAAMEAKYQGLVERAGKLAAQAPVTVTPPKPKTSPKVNRATDDVVVAISKLGGIDFDEATSQWGDVVRDSRKDLNNHVLRQTRRFGAVFKKGGKPLDKMRESLVGHGYLSDTADLHDLYSLIEDATRGKVAVSAENAQESEIEREAREYEEREIARLSEAEMEAHNAIIDALEDDDTVELGDTSFNFGYNTEGYDAERDIAEVQGYLEDPDAAAAGEGDSASEAHMEQTDDAGGWQQQVGVEGKKQVPTIGGVQQQGGRRVDTSSLMDGFTPEPPSLFDTPKYALAHQETPNFKKWSNNAPLVTAKDALTYTFKTGEKVVVEGFHGTARPDRVGTKFLKKRATSGPMSFFTSDPALASGYAEGKQDTSLANEDTDYPNWFKYKPQGSRSFVGIDRAWYFLPSEAKQKIAERMGDIRTDDDGNVIYEEGGGDIGSYQWELKQTQRGYDKAGNPLKAAVETWLMSGSIFNEEEKFLQVLELAGFPVNEIKYDPPHAAYPFVYKVYVAMQSPLVTDDIPQSVKDALNAAAKRDRSRAQRHGADMWDKNTRTLKDWVEEFNREENAYVWTSIPDKVTEVFKSLGYDGIIDVGGKGGGEKHKVYIPFEETQVKSAIGNKGTYDASKNDIRYSTKGDKGSPLTLSRVRSSFPNQQITEDNGTFTVTTPSGITLRISKVGAIEFDRAAAEKAYGREMAPDEYPVAEFRALPDGAIINLTEKGVSELDHEVFHFAMSAALKPGQIKAILNRFGTEEKAAAEYQRLKDSGAFEEKRGNIYLAAIFRFFRNLRELIAPTAKGAMQDVASGRVWGRAKQGRGGTKYAAAWHGSPHDFDKFKSSAIGTGEGAQAYGFGLYFASNQEVAEYYKRTLSGDGYGIPTIDGVPVDELTSLPVDIAHMLILEVDERPAKTLTGEAAKTFLLHHLDWFKDNPNYKDTYPLAKARIERTDPELIEVPGRDKQGRLYHVELAPTSDEYLDWDKPLSEQSEKVKAALTDEFAALREQYKGRDPLKMTGAEFYKGLADTDREASEMLHSLGVRGIKYLDGTSRNVATTQPQRIAKMKQDISALKDTLANPPAWWAGQGDMAGETRTRLKELEDALAKVEAEDNLNYNYVIFNESDVEIKAKYSLKSAFSSHSPAQLKAAVTVHPKVQALVGSVFNNGRNVNMWMRTVGTMYHTAEKLAAEGKPQFKAVFDKGQQFLSDVSAIAMQAEALAPDLFPKMGTGKGLFHNLSRKDAQAIADPLFQGTLFGGANPVNGKVFTPAELKRIFGLNDHQIELYRQARAAVDQSLDDMAKSLIARNAKEASAPFDRDMELSEMAQDVTDSINTLIADKKAALDQYEKDYQDSLKTAAPDQLKALEKEHKKLTREQEATIDLYESLVQNIDNLAKKTEALKKRGYFPLMRFGEYTVTMKDKDGKVEYFGLFESAFKAKLMEDKLKKSNPSSTVTQAVMGREKFKLYGGMNLEALQLFAEHLGADETAPYQEYLKVGLNNRSAMKRLIHRKGTEGFSEDAVRTLANFIVSNARHASTQYHLHDMRKLAAEIPEDTQGDVQDQAVKLYEYLTKPREEATKLRGYLFFHYLGGSLASGIVNMTQPLMMTTPYLASKTSLKNAIRHLTMASSNAFTDPKNVKGDLGIALRRAEAEGVTAPQEIYQLTAMASNKLLASNPYANAAMKAWGGFFSVAEAFNRRTTFIAAYRVAKENGKKESDAYKEATKAVTETQGQYNKGNRPNWGRGIIGAPLFTFKQFSVMYLELFNRLPKRQKAIMFGLLWFMAGLQGLPFAEDAEDIIDTIGQWTGHATNSKQWFNQKAEDTLGKTAGRFLTSGVSSVLPLDIQGRFGMQNLIPGTGVLKQSEIDKGRDVKEWFGAAGGLLASLGDALSIAATGSYGRAFLAASPRAVQSIAQGVEMAATGAGHDKYGRKTVEVSPQEATLKMSGFNPSRIAEESQVKSANMQDINLVRVRKQEIVNQWAYGMAHKDRGEIEAAKAKLRDWNEKNPEMKIRVSIDAVARKAKNLNTTGRERFLKSMPKEMRRKAIDELG